MPSSSRQKIPRIDLAKYRSDDPGDRRTAVVTGGDALREIGALRLRGHGVPPEPGAAMAESGRDGALRAAGAEVLCLLAEYFGLPEGRFRRGIGESGWSRFPTEGDGQEPGPALLFLVPRPETSSLEIEGVEGPRDVSRARSGELVAVAGPALHRLTDGVMPEICLRAGGEGDPTDLFVLLTVPTYELAPMEEFLEAKIP